MGHTVIIAIMLAFLLKVFVVEARVISSLSMYPTIEAGDRVLLNKLAYRFGGTPNRGDIVVFHPPVPERGGYTEDFIKRVVGLPGETVAVKDGAMWIDGRVLAESYLADAPRYAFGPRQIPPEALFVLGDNRNSSYDSHRWQDWLQQKDVKGKAVLRYWPLQRFGALE